MPDRELDREKLDALLQEHLPDLAAAKSDAELHNVRLRAALGKVEAALSRKPARVTATRQFSWTHMLPFALAYLGVLGYAMSCAFLKGFYGQLLPGLPIAFPFVDTLSTLIGYPLVAVVAVAGGVIWPYLSYTSITPEYRQVVTDTVLALEDARLEVVAARKAEKRLDDLLEPDFEGLMTRTNPPMTPEDQERARGVISSMQNNMRDFIAELSRFERTLRNRRLQLVLAAPWDWQPALFSASSSSRRRQLVVIPGFALLPFVMLLPVALQPVSDAYWLATVVQVLLWGGVALGLAMVVCGWRGTSILPRIRGELQTVVRLVFAIAAILFLVAASWCLGMNRAHVATAGKELPVIAAHLQDGTSVSGRSVTVVGSDAYYLLQDQRAGHHTYVIVKPDEVESATFSGR
jgi:hypothetical protein